MQSSARKFLLVGIAIIIVCVLGVYLVFHKTPQETPIMSPVASSTAPVYKVIGTSVEKRKIESYTYGTGTTSLLFVGGMHGGYEWNAVLLAYQFMDYLSKNATFIPSNLSVIVIPDLNPDGVYAVTGKEGRFVPSDVSTDKTILASGRFNANNVDLNRNFDCKWKPTSTWQNKTVSAGKSVFSEPEALALKNVVLAIKPSAAIFWHSQSNTVYASECTKGILPQTLDIMNAYAKAAGYGAVKKFDAYPVTGDSEGWLASIGIPAITVEMKTHDSVEWSQNLAGIKAILQYYSQKK